MKRFRIRRTGLTLIELIVAVVLSSVLFIAVLSVMTSVGRQRDFYITTAEQLNRPTIMIEQLKRDFVSADYVSLSENAIQFEGHGGTGRESGIAIALPTTIKYEIANVDDRYWITRSESQTDVASANISRELMIAGISQFDIQQYETATGKWISLIWNKNQKKRMNAPARLRIIGTSFDESGEVHTKIDEILIRHGVGE